MAKKREGIFLDVWLKGSKKRVITEQNTTDETENNGIASTSAEDVPLMPATVSLEQQITLSHDVPHQPTDASLFPVQYDNGKSRSFQPCWYKKFPWLHYFPEGKAVLCYYCSKANRLSLLELSTKTDAAFIVKGYTYWKNALTKFSRHESSACHRHAIMQLQQAKAAPINAQLSAQKAAEQASSREALLAVFSSVRFLARQGLALRGHDECQGT